MDVVKVSIIKAAIATSLILSLGILVGFQMDDARTNFLEDQLKETNLQTETYLITQRYLEESSKNYCKVMEQKIPEIAKQNAQTGRDLQAFSSRSIGSKDDYIYIKKRYYINQLKLYTLLQNYRERCDDDVNLIFFFFEDSVDSKRQGAVLTKYREDVNNKTYVFSYNLGTKNSTVIEMLKTDYGIDSGPSMVINGDEIYREYVPLKELRRVME